MVARIFSILSKLTTWAMLFFLFPGTSQAAEKLAVGTPVRAATFDLPMMAAEEGAIWKANGLEVDWVPFKAGSDLVRATVAGALKVGMTSSAAVFQAAARGALLTIVGELYPKQDFSIWVLADSRIKQVGDLKGAKIGVPGFGGLQHAMGRYGAKSLAIEKEIKFVSTGGQAARMAMFRTRAIDAVVGSSYTMLDLKFKGEVREVLSISEHLPEPWVDHVIVSHRQFSKEQPETVRKAVSAILQAVKFIRNNPEWSVQKIKALTGFSDEAARQLHKIQSYTEDGRVKPKALENVRDFLISYGIVSREGLPPLDELYSTQFVR